MQRERASYAIERPRLDRQRLGQVRHDKPSPALAAAPGLLDHPGAQVDSDHVSALIEQPLGLRA
jgi:hypothetical protein